MGDITVVDGNKEKGVLSLDPPKNYKKLKIEKLGNDALSLVLNYVKKGYSYRKIAEEMTDIYKKVITHKDVSAVMQGNAKLMSQYRTMIDHHNLERANMVLNESTTLVSDMDRLDNAFTELEQRMVRAISTKDIVEISKAMTDLSRTRTSMIKNFKKLTGQFSEATNVLIDKSKKEVNINTKNDEATSKLVKELSRAQFKSNIPKIEEKKDIPAPTPEQEDAEDAEVERIVDAEIIDEKEKDEE